MIPNRDPLSSRCFFFNDTATTEIYTLSLHDALPILWQLTFPLPAGMTLLHDFSHEVPTGGYPSSRVQINPDGPRLEFRAKPTGGAGTYFQRKVWDRQTGGSQALQLPSGIGGLRRRSI